MEKTLTRAEWVNKYFTAFMEAIDTSPNNYNIDVYNSEDGDKKITQITYQAINVDYHLTYGIAKCSTSDTYHYKTGIAIAYARLIGEQLHPDFICEKAVKLKTLKVGDKIKIGKDSKYSYIVLNIFRDIVNGHTITVVTVKGLATGRYFVYRSDRRKRVFLLNS